jgi:hypothetical protein
MHNEELPTTGLHGSYRDVLLDAAGQVTWDSGWQKNTIVLDCRRLLAALMKGQAGTLGIQGIRFGAGSPLWDGGLPPSPLPSDTALTDPHPYLVPVGSLQLQYLDPVTNTVSVSPTKVLQIVATLGVNQPSWPDANHVDGTLREFGLVGQLGGAVVLVNEVRHVAIPKDPVSTLVRTIQLVF